MSEQIDIFKYKDIPLYSVDLPYGKSLTHREFFTRIPWGEYKRIRFAEKVVSLDPFDLKIEIFKNYTYGWLRDASWHIDSMPYGIIETVADLIMYVSDSGIIPDSKGNIDIPGFNARLNMYRIIASNNVEYKMYTIICSVFRAYTFEALDKLPFDKIASLFASAETHLLETGILKEPLSVYNPEDNRVANNTDKFNKKISKPNNAESALELKGDSLESLILNYKKESLLNSQEQASKEQGVIPPTQPVAIVNNKPMKVPGLDLRPDKGGFEDADFKAPRMTDEEALAMQIEMGLEPAGYELVLERQNKENKKNQTETKKPFGKKTFKRK
jgi:hypothetical protein